MNLIRSLLLRRETVYSCLTSTLLRASNTIGLELFGDQLTIFYLTLMRLSSQVMIESRKDTKQVTILPMLLGKIDLTTFRFTFHQELL